MYLEIIYKIWRFFIRSVIAIVTIVILLGVLAFGVLQLPYSKDLIKNYLVEEFNYQYEGQLTVRELDGTIPLNFQFRDVKLQGPRVQPVIEGDSLIQAESINISLKAWDLLFGSLNVSELNIVAPNVYMRWLSSGKLSLSKAFESNNRRDESDRPFWESREVWAPNITITEGVIRFNQELLSHQTLNFPKKFQLDSLSATAFLEMTPSQRILEFENLSFNVPWIKDDKVSVSGQLYNDNEVLELNGLNLELGNNRVSLTGSMDSLDLYKPNIGTQLSESQYDFNLESTFEDIEPWTYQLTGHRISIPHTLQINVTASGKFDQIDLQKGLIAYNDSEVRLDGEVNSFSDTEIPDFNLNIDSSNVKPKDLLPLVDNHERWSNFIQEWPETRIAGSLRSDKQQVKGDFNLRSDNGDFKIALDAENKEQWIYTSSLYARDANIGSSFSNYIDSTNINADLVIEGDGWNWRSGIYDLKADIFNSTVNSKNIEQLTYTAQILDGYMDHSFRYETGDELLTAEGAIDFSEEVTEWSLEGEANQFRPQPWMPNEWLTSSEFNGVFNFDGEGTQFDNLSGKGSVDIDSSFVNGEMIEPHQLYADLSWINENRRELRLTSSLMDLNVQGTLDIDALHYYGKYWKDYLQQHWNKEIARLPDSLISFPKNPGKEIRKYKNLDLDIEAALKEPGLLKKYWPQGPSIKADAFSFVATIKADTSALDIESRAQANHFEVDSTISIDMPNYRFNASFDHNRNLRNSVRLDLRSRFENWSHKGNKYEKGTLELAVTQDTISYRHSINRDPGNVRFSVEASARLEEDVTNIWLTNLFLGSDKYAWRIGEVGRMAYQEDQSFDFKQFRLINGNQELSVNGVLSGRTEHSLEYNFNEVRLDQISDIIDGKVAFEGVLDGSIQTHSLTRNPYIQGEMKVNRLAVNNRILGDVLFTSNYDPLKDRFNTSLRVYSDTTEYDLNMQEGFNQGQEVYVNGYFNYPQDLTPKDTLYKFNLNIEKADAWLIAEIMPNIFESIEGQVQGTGQIAGNLSDINYGITLATNELYSKPVFLETDYWMNGNVHINNDEGIVLDSLNIDDGKGGTGLLYGSVDLNEFKPVKYLNLTMELNELQFLNNKFSQDVPFYGSVAGTGTIKLTGENVDPYLRTVDPMEIGSNSVISIPLLEETEFEQNNKFIRFVNSFHNKRRATAESLDLSSSNRTDNDIGSNSQTKLSSEEKEEDQEVESPSDQSFSELFSLDLQFTAQQNSQVRLIFDRVTGEVLTAEGSGQGTITLEDEEMQMYGDFRITEGEYQFVSGDIFRRKFYLQNGGSIVWEGPIDNARLNIDAVYRARPDISVLLPSANRQNQVSQRVPVELLLQITGTIESIENNFSFRLPSEMDISRGDIALQNVINQLNNSGNKLIQATSLLLTDSFLPVSEAGNVSNQELSSSLQRTSGTSIVVSPLLSNQINTLLNDMISASDVDVNLNVNNISELDQIDLGIALRLFNDRVVLSGQGQVTGERRNLEDIGATVRINRAFSVKAFHRLDPAILTSVTNQTQTNQQYLNGIGLEAQFQFNTWADFKEKVSKAVRNIFSISSDGRREEEDKVAENTGDSKQE